MKTLILKALNAILQLNHYISYLKVVFSFYVLRKFRKPYHIKAFDALMHRAHTLKKIRRYESILIFKILRTAGINKTN